MVRIKWHIPSKQVENRINLFRDSDRDEGSHIESKKTSKLLWSETDDTYVLNK